MGNAGNIGKAFKELSERLGMSIDEIAEAFGKRSGAKELDLGDIQSPSIKRGRPSKPLTVNPNEIDLGKSANKLEIGEVPSSVVSPGEIDLGDIQSPSIKKGRPAKSPVIDPNEIDLGKSNGKLQIGDVNSSSVPLNEIDLGDVKPFTPNIDNYKLPVSSAGTSPVGGGKVPAIIGQTADDIPGALSTRASTIPTEVGPQVMGKGTSRFTGKADDVVDAEFTDKIKKGISKADDAADQEVLNKINKMPDGPLKTSALKKYAPWAIATLVGGKIVYDKVKDGESPSVEFKAPKINGAPTEQEEAATASQQNNAAVSVDKSKSQASKLSKILDEATTKTTTNQEPEKSDELSYMKMMQDAQQAESQNRLNAALLKAAMQAGAAIAGPGVKIDTSIADALAESAGKPVSNIKSLMDTDISSKKLQQIKEEMNDDAKMRDPDSEISKMMANAAIKAGLIKPGTKISAAALDKSGLNLTAILNAQENARNRAANIELNKQNRLFEAERKKLEKKEEAESTRLDKRKLVTEEIEGFRQNIKSNIKRAEDLIDKAGTFELTGDENEELNALMDEMSTDMAKLQDPKSVARPAEVKLVRQNLVPGTMLGKLGMRNETAKSLLNKFEQRVDERADTAYGVRGVETPKPVESNKLTTSNSIRTFKSSYTPGSIITTKSGETYRIGEDGKTGTKLNE